jgi:O-antigen ligase
MAKAAFIIYLFVLVLAPLLFGAVHTYAYTGVAVGVLAATGLLLAHSIRKDLKTGTPYFHFPKTGLNLLMLLVLAYLIFQLVPVPHGLIQRLSPEAAAVIEQGVPASGAVLSADPTGGWHAIVPYTFPVRLSLIRFAVYAFFFIGFVQTLNSRKRIETALFWILLAGCFEALYGLAQAYLGSGHIWWFSKAVYGSQRDVTGTYINRNHLAGFMEMGILLAVCYAAALGERRRKRTVPGYRPTLRARFSGLLSGEARFNKRVLILFAGVVMGIGLIFSASRGGMIAAAGAMACLGLLFLLKPGHRRLGGILLLLFLITAVYAMGIGAEYPIGRFSSFEASMEDRIRYGKRTLVLFEAYSLTGVGIGNFRHAFPPYQSTLDAGREILYAHNDWAQFLAEAGLVGAVLLLVGLLSYFRGTMGRWNKRSDAFAVCLGAAPLAVMTAMAVHSYSDFNLHIPANFLLLTAVIAIGTSALHLESRRGRDKDRLPRHRLPMKCRGLFLFAALAALLLWCGVWTVRHFVAEAYCNTARNSTLNRDPNPSEQEIRRAMAWDGDNAAYRYKLGRELGRLRYQELLDPRMNAGDRRARRMDLVRNLEAAAEKNPFDARTHVRLAWEYTRLWSELDFREKWLPAADLSMERAARFAGADRPMLQVSMGDYWIWRSKRARPLSRQWDRAMVRARRHYITAQTLVGTRSLSKDIQRFIWQFYPDPDMVRPFMLTGLR